MKRLLAASMILTFALIAVGCGDDEPTNPSDNNTVVFNATLSPANEPNGVQGGEANSTGSAVITMHLTRDAAQQITSANIDFAVSLAGLPVGTSISAAHIHTGAAGVNGGILIGVTTLASGEFVAPASGTIQFTKSITGAGGDTVTGIINNPAGFYFNVHSPTNTGGFTRGQLVKQ